MKNQGLLALLLLAGAPAAVSAEPAPAPAAVSATEAKLREALRAATLQIRAVQTELADTRASLEAKEKEAASLKKKSDALAKQGAEDRDAAAKAAETAKAGIASRDERITQLTASLEHWKTSAEQASALAAKTEAERVRFSASVDRLTLLVADREAKNIRLVALGNEILNRFEKFGLGDAIAGREPFIGVKRVELQNLVQDYADKVADQKYSAPAQAPVAPNAAAAAPTKPETK